MRGKTKKLICSILVVPGYLICMIIVLLLFKAIIMPNELEGQNEFIRRNIAYTKDAYGINIDETYLNTPNVIENVDINKTKEVINNIPIVSKDLVLKDLNATQTVSGKYIYKNSSIGEYYIDGEKSLVYITPREVVSYNGISTDKSNEYTHGYSTVISSVSSTTETGNMNHIQKLFDSTNEKVTIVEPRIYFGMQTDSTIVTNVNNKIEYDYPILSDDGNSKNAENIYDGEAGLKLNILDRFILSIKNGDLSIAFPSNLNKDSKILINRNIIKRAKIIMPYLIYDENPYLVINEEGRLIWVLDAYTMTDAYPYSQKTIVKKGFANNTELNYIRNSVKVLIDAYNGTIKFYITDRTDPIAMSYEHMYPDVFASKDEKIPADIMAHFIYPSYLFDIQSNIIKRYHNVDIDSFYRGEDIWEVATHNTGKVITKTGTDIEPYYAFSKLSNNEESKLSLILPYTPHGKQNLESFLFASYDELGNGVLKIYKYNSNSNIMGPMQLDNQIEQDKVISEELEILKKTDGIKIVKNMIIIPFENSILYVEPIYQQLLNEKEIKETVPVLKKVIVASGNKVAIGDNLKQALNNLVSKYAVDIEVENTDNLDDLINAIIKANNNLTASNNSDNWEMIGKDIKKLQELINKLETTVKENNENKNELENKNVNVNETVDSF